MAGQTIRTETLRKELELYDKVSKKNLEDLAGKPIDTNTSYRTGQAEGMQLVTRMIREHLNLNEEAPDK